MNYDPLKQILIPVPTPPPLPQKHPHAFFKHKAKKIFLNFEKVFRQYAVSLHIVSV